MQKAAIAKPLQQKHNWFGSKVYSLYIIERSKQSIQDILATILIYYTRQHEVRSKYQVGKLAASPDT
jgi:hypothetical protein